MRRVRTFFLGMFVLVGTAGQINAEPITLSVYGTIDSFLRGDVLDEIPVGSAFAMQMTWESETPATESADGVSTYDNALTGAIIWAHDITFSLSPADGSSVLYVKDTPEFDSLSGGIRDDTTGSSDEDLFVWLTKFELVFPADTWSTTDIPTSLPALLESGLAKLYVYNFDGGTNTVIEASLARSENVPEPSTLLVMGVGLCAAVGFRRRRAAIARA